MVLQYDGHNTINQPQNVAILKLLRIKHWIKNSFVFAPLIFSGQFLLTDALLQSVIAFFLFCCAASAVYIVNDIVDVENDRLHPEKSKTRPLASDQISLTTARFLLLFMLAISASAFLVSTGLGFVILAYVVLNLAYSFKLKQVPVVDIFCIAIGFVLRVYAGAIAINVTVSIWMFISTLSLALFLAAIKRRQELITTGSNSRQSLQRYNVEVLTRYAEISSISALIFYSIYVALNHPHLSMSIPFVIFGLFRYWYIVEFDKQGESPTDALVSDPILIITILAWIGIICYSLAQAGAV